VSLETSKQGPAVMSIIRRFQTHDGLYGAYRIDGEILWWMDRIFQGNDAGKKKRTPRVPRPNFKVKKKKAAIKAATSKAGKTNKKK